MINTIILIIIFIIYINNLRKCKFKIQIWDLGEKPDYEGGPCGLQPEPFPIPFSIIEFLMKPVLNLARFIIKNLKSLGKACLKKEQNKTGEE